MVTDAWYYTNDQRQVIGPVDLATMRSLFSRGELSGHVLVWRADFPDWQNAAARDELKDLVAPPPLPPLPPAVSAIPSIAAGHAYASPPAANRQVDRSVLHPWRRWLARQYDVYLFTIAAVLALKFGTPEVFRQYTPSGLWASAVSGARDPLGALFLGVAEGVFSLLIYVPYEGFVVRLFGNTPIRALLKIRISRADGRPIDLGTAFCRAFRVYVFGQGMGVFVVAWVANLSSYLRLNEKGATRWDEECGIVVRCEDIGAGRWVVAAAVLCLLTLIQLIGLALWIPLISRSFQ